MPQGKGTYGSKVGRPPKKKKIDPPNSKKKKGVSAPTGNQRMKKRKKKAVNTTSAPAGYSRRTRMNMAAKEAVGGALKRKKKKTKAGKAGYGPQDRLGTFAKKKKVKTTGPRKKGYIKDVAAIIAGDKGPKKKASSVKKNNGGVKKALKKGKVTKAKTSSKPQNKRQLALKKRADARGKKKGGRKTLAQLRKEGKINF